MKLSDKELFDPIFLDNHLFVVSKKSNCLTQPTSEKEISLETEAKRYLKRKFNKKGAVFLVPLHRLDRVASGLVLFARTSKALSRLQEQMRQRKIKKTYMARVQGKLRQKEGVLRHFLIHARYRAKSVSPKQGKEALLRYKVIFEDRKTSWLEIELETGRYHQIRCQFSLIGHPILGDTKYGAYLRGRFEGIDLHHQKLCFIHPVTKVSLLIKKEVSFSTPRCM